MAALALTGLGFLASIGLSTSLVVLFAVATALTLLPALLSLLGDRVDAGRVVGRRRIVTRAEDTAWWRLPTVSGRPWPYLAVGAAVLLALAAPALQMETGFPDAGDDPASTTHRRAYDLLAEGFGPGLTFAAARRRPAPLRRGRPGHRCPGRAHAATPASPRSASRGPPLRGHRGAAHDPHHCPRGRRDVRDPGARPWPAPGQRRRVGPDRHDRRPHPAAVRHPAHLRGR